MPNALERKGRRYRKRKGSKKRKKKEKKVLFLPILLFHALDRTSILLSGYVGGSVVLPERGC